MYEGSSKDGCVLRLGPGQLVGALRAIYGLTNAPRIVWQDVQMSKSWAGSSSRIDALDFL